MEYAYIYECGHTDDCRLLNSQSRDATFSKVDRLIPVFLEGCCGPQCAPITLARSRYTYQDRKRFMRLCNINEEYHRCTEIVAAYNILAKQHNLSPILVAEFEHLLVRMYSWIRRAAEYEANNGSYYFHDVCFAIGISTLQQIIAMRLTIQHATMAMPAPWMGPVFEFDTDPIHDHTGLTTLRDLCPEISDHALKLTISSAYYGFRPLPQGYTPFEAIWRSKLKRKDTTPQRTYR